MFSVLYVIPSILYFIVKSKKNWKGQLWRKVEKSGRLRDGGYWYEKKEIYIEISLYIDVNLWYQRNVNVFITF